MVQLYLYYNVPTYTKTVKATIKILTINITPNKLSPVSTVL